MNFSLNHSYMNQTLTTIDVRESMMEGMSNYVLFFLLLTLIFIAIHVFSSYRSHWIGLGLTISPALSFIFSVQWKILMIDQFNTETFFLLLYIIPVMWFFMAGFYKYFVNGVFKSLRKIYK